MVVYRFISKKSKWYTPYMEEPTPVFVNVEAVIYKNGKFLMAVRSDKEVHASGDISLVGGKVDFKGIQQNILETTLKREIEEEVGIVVEDKMTYVKSSTFESIDKRHFVDIVFVCIYKSGDARVASEEVAEVKWMSFEEIMADSRVKPWTRDNIEKAKELI